MLKNKIIRVAFVKLSPNGKAYPMRCDRKDIREGNEVEVLMRADYERAYYMEGIVDSIQYHRWNCKCSVMNLTSEVEYSLTDDCIYQRDVKLSTELV